MPTVETSAARVESVLSKGLWNRPRNSWRRNLPMRVPASTVVRMKSASNMMAKWYQ